MNRNALRLCLVLAALAATPAWAGSDSKTLTVTANVKNSCRIDATTNVPAVDYDPLVASDAVSGAGAIAVRCNKNATYKLSIEKPSATRTLSNGTESLTYDLYTDATAATVWPVSAAEATQKSFVDVATSTFQVYAKIPAGQDVSAGVYTDTVNATVDF